jgi:D-alanine transaminase
MKYLWKGNLVDYDGIKIDINDRGYQFGDGIYEYVRVYNGKLFALKEHLDRLENSAKLIDLNLGYTRDEIKGFCEQLIKANDLDSGNVYLQITRGDGIVRNHLYPEFKDQKAVISGFTTHYYRNNERIESGVKAILYPDLRWALCNVKSLNLLPNCMAIAEAHKYGANKAILYKGEYITEERAGNVLIVKDGKVITHPDGPEILPGITKMLILQILKERKMPFEERKFTKDELLNADEVIVSDTKTECCPVIKIGDKVIGDGKRGPVTKKIDDAYKELIVKQCGKVM